MANNIYQRKKSRDLFDLWLASQQSDLNIEQTIMAFQKYMEHENQTITRAMFEENLANKMQSSLFTADISPILSSRIKWNIVTAANQIKKEYLSLLPGDPWKENHDFA